MARQISIRLGTEGKAQVVADLDAIGKTGDAAFTRTARAAMKAGQDAEAAIDRANRSAQKLEALLPGLNPTKLDMAAGVRDGIGKSAESSAAVFEAAYAKMEARANALRAAIDPAFGAQQRFDREMAEARTLISAGAISLDDYVAKLRQERAALEAVTGVHGGVVAKTGQMRQAMAGASYQVQDLVTQVSMGANPLMALSVQGGQLAGQFMNVGGKAGAVASFFMGPWGLAIQVALMAALPLYELLKGTKSELEKETKALQENADKAAVTAQAKAAFAKTEAGAKADVAALTEELNKQNEALRTNAERMNIRAKNDLAVLQKAQADAQTRLSLLNDTPNKANYSERLQLQKEIAARNAAITAAEVAVQQTRVGLAVEAAKRMVDPIEQINRKYNKQAEAAQLTADRAARGHNVVTSALTRQLAAIEANRAAALKAEQDKQKAVGETARQYGREVTSAQASAIARAAGLQVNSADRSTARQQQLYDDWIAKGRPKENPVAKPGTSAHERGNALDIQFQAGITAKKIRDAFAAEGVRLTKVFAETGHWHVEWARTAAQKDAEADAAEATRDLAKANRELDGDLAEVVKQFDPARAAADEYAATLAKIDALLAGGRITRGQASGYRMDAFHQEQQRRADAQLAQFKVLFGNDDPLSAILDQGQIAREAWWEEYQDRQERQREGVRDLAGYYRDLMTGGTTSFLDLMRQKGLEVISELLAKWTLGKSADGTGGVLGAITKLFKGSAAIGSITGSGLGPTPDIGGAISAVGSSGIPKLASGTEYWSGGTALLGEHGPERAWLPKGTRVTPAGATSREAMAVRGGDKHYYFSGNLLTPEFWQQIQAGNDGAAMRGAAGGSQLAQREVSRQQSRVLT